ncbi:ubiquitin carboxyl-terminal hydrolase [Mycena floridula]|nr:ubiquitin carboxyl-terminal hydrolase [Mycena floridula]
MAPRTKHYLPLESNPEVFTHLIRKLGVDALEFQDVFSIDEPDLLAMITRPVLALVLVFPTSEAYEKFTADEEASRTEYTGSGADEEVFYFKQTIGNACGLYAILHALSNGPARDLIVKDSPLARLIETVEPLGPAERATALEESAELEQAHTHAAKQGDSAVPESAEAEVDYHYVCFVASRKTHRLFEMDGSKKGPVDRGIIIEEGQDVMCDAGLGLIREFLQREAASGNENFSLLALVPSNT